MHKELIQNIKTRYLH